MTGNSMDAADAVWIRFTDDNVSLLSTARMEMPHALAAQLIDLTDKGGSADDFMEAQNAVTQLCSNAVLQLNADWATVDAIGCHGQTLCHNPVRGYSWQLLNGALLAELVGIDTVCDFRSRDIAAGGQGAPLAPAFHRYAFSRHAPCAVVNIGGIANITILDDSGGVIGFDTGPGNMLMDAWHREHWNYPYDKNGAWAKSGKNSTAFLKSMLAHPFFSRPPPKSCGREEFALPYFHDDIKDAAPADVQRGFLELTAQSIAAAVCTTQLFLCGGGAKNTALCERIDELLPDTQVRPTDAIGLPAEHVEAATFAWLAKEHIERKTIPTKTITGAADNRVLGALYPKG